MEGTILRSWINSLEGGPRYRASIAFSQPFELIDDLKFETKDQAQEDSPHSTISDVYEIDDDLPSIDISSNEPDDPTLQTILEIDFPADVFMEKP